jgi:hypothetical protein
MPVECTTTNSKDYFIRCSWEKRAETTNTLAARFLRMMDSFGRIDPVFSLWECGRRRTEKLENIRDRYAELIAEGVSRDDWNQPEPIYGYRFGAWTRDTPKNRSFTLSCHAGSTIASVFPNDVVLETNAPRDIGPDPYVVSYPIFRSALLAMVDAWEPISAEAYSYQLLDLNLEKSYFPRPWIQYLCPWLAQKITPPASALVERLPDGELLMSSATETFDVANPQHLAVATDIAAAMAPLERLPWPSRP